MSNDPTNPELRAAITSAATTLAEFRAEDEAHAANPLAPTPAFRSWSYALAAHLSKILQILA